MFDSRMLLFSTATAAHSNNNEAPPDECVGSARKMEQNAIWAISTSFTRTHAPKPIRPVMPAAIQTHFYVCTRAKIVPSWRSNLSTMRRCARFHTTKTPLCTNDWLYVWAYAHPSHTNSTFQWLGRNQKPKKKAPSVIDIIIIMYQHNHEQQYFRWVARFAYPRSGDVHVRLYVMRYGAQWDAVICCCLMLHYQPFAITITGIISAFG